MNSTSLVLAAFQRSEKNICLIFPFFPLKVNDENRISSVTALAVHNLLNKPTKYHFDSSGKKVKRYRDFLQHLYRMGKIFAFSGS